MKRIICILSVVVLAGCGRATQLLEPSMVMSSAMDYAVAIHANTCSNATLDSLMAASPEFQTKVTEALTHLTGVMPSGNNEASKVRIVEVPAAVSGSCSQMVEYKTVVHDAVFCANVTSFNDPSRGTEYLFEYWPWWSVDPNDVRWASTDAQVTWALWAAYGSLGGSNLCGRPLRLMVGDHGLWLAGGLDRVRRSLYVHHA